MQNDVISQVINFRIPVPTPEHEDLILVPFDQKAIIEVQRLLDPETSVYTPPLITCLKCPISNSRLGFY